MGMRMQQPSLTATAGEGFRGLGFSWGLRRFGAWGVGCEGLTATAGEGFRGLGCNGFGALGLGA